jgi:hypothetical protein
VPKSSTRSDSDSAAPQKWAERLDRFRPGHHKIAEFCAAEGVSVSNFYLWRRRLNSPVPSPAINSPVVVPLRITPQPGTPTESPQAPIELVLPSGAIVRLPGTTTPTMIVAILRGMEGRPC